VNRASDNENFINGKYCDNRIHSLSRCQSLNLFLFPAQRRFRKNSRAYNDAPPSIRIQDGDVDGKQLERRNFDSG